jgi:transcriptional regulator with XRE-family HTH domain
MTWTQLILDAIAESGLSDHQVAKQAGVPQPVVSRFRSGARSISLASAEKIASALGLELKTAAKAKN